MARERERSRRSSRDDDTGKKSVGFKGRAGMDRIDEETERAEARRNKKFAPYRYKASWDKRDVNPIIILDESLQDAFFLHEHSVQDAEGNWGRKSEVCVREQDNCPLCALHDSGRKDIGPSNYIMCLTVLDLKPYKNKNNVKVKYSKKLFVIKNAQQQGWLKTLEKAEKKFGTLRGVYMELERSSDKEAATGKPGPLEVDWYGDDADDKPYALVDEKDLIEEYGHDAVKSDSGRVIKEQDADITPYAYDEVFEYPDVEELEKSYGSKSRAGSSRDNDDDGWREERSSRRSKRGADDEDEERGSRRTRRGRGRDEEAEDDSEETEERRPVSRSRRNRDSDNEEETEKPKRSGRSRRAAEDDEGPEEAEERGDEEEAPKAPPRTKGEASEDDEPKGRKRSGRGSRKADEEEAEEEPKSRKSRAGTRRGRAAEAEDEEDEIPF